MEAGERIFHPDLKSFDIRWMVKATKKFNFYQYHKFSGGYLVTVV